MAETLRELVVSLSLQSDNFSKNIKSINAQIREVESRFNQAGAGVDGFAKSTDGLKAKAGVLAEKLELQKNIVGQYEQSLKKATDTLEKNKAKHDTLKTTLTDQKAKYAALKSEMDKASAALKKSVKDTGDNSEKSVELGVALEDLKTEYSALGDEIKKNEGALTRNTNTLRSNADTVSKTSDGLNKARGAQKELRAELEKTNRAIKTHQAAWLNAAENLDKFGNRATAAGQKLSRAGALLSATVTAPIVALGGAAIKASIDYESAFAGVRKTVDATEEEFAALSKAAIEMSHVLPASATEIAGVMEVGGQLGVHKDALEAFTQTIIDLGESTNLAGEQGATQMAKFANIVGMSQAEFGKLGSVLVELGNNMATTEADIMNMSMRLAGAGSQVGLTEAEIAGFAAALSSVGIEAEAGGSAFSKAMIAMAIAAETGGEELDDFARVSGMTAKEFQSAFQEDAASAIQAFIVGLSQMDEQGVSTIKTLQDIGMTEVRLRDTLMRATNASGLFGNAVGMANRAWKENNALAKEAGQRYATTESRLKMLKNQATTFTRTLGDDLSPIVDDLIEMAGGWIDKLNEMEPAQRQTLMTTAAWLAAIGPGVMIIGKMNTAVGSLTTGLSTLIKTSVEAGGGLKGLFAAVGSLLGPAGIAVLAGAAVYGAYKWYDYASGAKAAREATEAIMETAQRWKDTQALTIFDTGNDPLARFGLTRESFAGGAAELDNWLSRLTATWSDGKKETHEIVKGYVDEFVAGSDEIREAIKKRQETQEKYGVTGDESLESALKTLKDYDTEIEKLLKKRQNKMLSEDDQARLEQIIQERVELQLKFVTGEGGSYQSLAEAVEAEKARLAAEGKEPGADLYGDAIMGAAEGYQAQVDAINQSYHDQYAALKAITDENERLGAIKALNAEHTRSLAAAQGEYNDLVAQFAPEAFESEEVQKAKEDMEALRRMISEGASPEALTAFVEALDEGHLASYIALLKQMEEADLSNLNLSKDGEPAVTVSDLLGGYDTIADYLKDHTGVLGSIGELLGAAGEEASRVLVEIGFTTDGEAVKAQLEAWEKDGIELSVIAEVAGYNQATGAPMTIQNISIKPVTGDVVGYDQVTGDPIKIGGVNLAPEKGEITGYDQATGEPIIISGVNISPVTGAVTGYNQATGEPVDIGGVNINPITGEITGYDQESGTTYSIGNVSINPEQGTIDGYNQKTGEPIKIKNVSLEGETGTIIEYREGTGAKKPTPEVKAKLTYDDFSGVDQSAIDKYFAENTDQKPSIVTNVGLQPGWAAKLKTAFDEGKVTVFDADGVPLPLNPEVLNKIGAKDVWIEGFDEDGNPTLSVVITHELGTKEAAEVATENLEQKPVGIFGFEIGDSAQDKVDFIKESAAALAEFKKRIDELNEGGEDTSRVENDLAWVEGDIINTLLRLQPGELAKIGEAIATVMAALASGEMSEEDAQNILAPLLAVVESADALLGAGNAVSAGIADGMKSFGWTGTAETLKTDIETAINAALGINSPAKTMIPIGASVAEGMALGINRGAYKVKAAMIKMAREAVNAAKNELKIESPSRVLRDEVGVMMARGVGRGLTLGGKEQERIIANAARQMADAGVAGVRSDNRRTYNQQTTLSLEGANLYIRDEQDIRSLAIEFAALTKRQQRGMGMRMA